jgi:hypothetical protein
MADFRITIGDQVLLDGITWARNQYNAGPPPDNMLMADDNEYVSWLVTTAAASYAQQMGQAAMATADVDGKVTDAIAAAETGDTTKLQALLDGYTDPGAAQPAVMGKI